MQRDIRCSNRWDIGDGGGRAEEEQARRGFYWLGTGIGLTCTWCLFTFGTTWCYWNSGTYLLTTDSTTGILRLYANGISRRGECSPYWRNVCTCGGAASDGMFQPPGEGDADGDGGGKTSKPEECLILGRGTDNTARCLVVMFNDKQQTLARPQA